MCALHKMRSRINARSNLLIYLSTRVERLSRGLVSQTCTRCGPMFIFCRRIERIEFLDEVDLLNQLLAHYCIAWAVNDVSHIGKFNWTR